MEHEEVSQGPVEYTCFVGTTVSKEWVTDSYKVTYRVMAESAGSLIEVHHGVEHFGPLWGVEQVEQLVSMMSDRLRETDWAPEVRASGAAHPGCPPP